jgi:3-hydroxybutyryl-CoA dehydratase
VYSEPPPKKPLSAAASEKWTFPEEERVPLVAGQTFSSPSKTITNAHFLMFSGVTSDNHPIHYDVEYARRTRFGKPLAHGLLVASLTALGASSVARHLEGYIFLEQGSRFLGPLLLGDTITPRFRVEKIWTEGRKTFARIETALINQHGEAILEGFHLYQVLDHSADSKTAAPPKAEG